MAGHSGRHGRRVGCGARWAGAAAAAAGCAAAMGLGATPAWAATGYPVTATIAVGNTPRSVAVDPSLRRVYVTSASGVSVIDESGDARSGTVVSTIPSSDPFTAGAAVDLSDHNLYVVDPYFGVMSVIDESGDADTGTVTSTVAFGSVPNVGELAVDSSNHNVYVTGTFDPQNLGLPASMWSG